MAELVATATTVSGVLVPLGYIGCWCWNICSSLANRKKLCLVLPRKGGKSSLNKQLTSIDPNILLVDLDEVLKVNADTKQVVHLNDAEARGDLSTAKLLKFELMKKSIEKVKSNWLQKAEHRAVFLTSDFELAKEIFKVSSICVAVPSDKLFVSINEKLNKEEQEIARHSRAEFLKSFNPSEYSVYNTFEGLSQMVMNVYNLTYRV